MRHFVRLIRPINIAIIMITMIGCAYYIHTTNYFQFVRFNAFHFSLLIVSTVLIAAAGNIINDYFDIKADKINKPDRVVIGKFIKKRWAIALHWIFNVIAVLISIYLSIYYQSLWFVFIQVVIVNLLWFYSLYFKKKILIGNFIIALMTGIIPLLVVVFFKVSNESTQAFSSYHASTWTIYVDYSYFLEGLDKDFLDFSGFNLAPPILVSEIRIDDLQKNIGQVHEKLNQFFPKSNGRSVSAASISRFW